MATKKTTHGGARLGAGRPTVFGDRITWIVRLPAELAQAADERRKGLSLSQSQLVEAALEKFLRQRK